MKIKFLLVFLIFSLLIFEGLTQKRSRRRSSFGRSSFRIKSKSSDYKKESSGWLESILASGVAVIFGYFNIFKAKDRKEQVKAITDEFEKEFDSQNGLSQDQITLSLKKFEKTPWKVQYKSRSSEKTQQWDLNISSLSQKTNSVYDLIAKGSNDKYGDSQITGIIILKQGGGISLCFDKQYRDKRRSGQKGKCDLLIYEAHQKDDQFQGGWYFKTNDALVELIVSYIMSSKDKNEDKKRKQYDGTMRIFPQKK